MSQTAAAQSGAMARPLRIEFPGAVYHVTARGNARERIVLDDDDCRVLLATLSRSIDRYGWICHGYCLMPNHYHLLVETPRPNLSLGMRHLNGVYAQRFNERYARVGHLLQGRYKAILVEREVHLLELCRYVVLNPVRAGLCEWAASWCWSSYRATAGEELAPDFLTVEWVLEQFADEQTQAQALYRAFVGSGAPSEPWSALRGQIYLGGDRFIAQHVGLRRKPEIPHEQTQPLRPPLEEIFARHGERGTLVAYRDYGYRLREIGDHLRVHYTTVSRRLGRLETTDM